MKGYFCPTASTKPQACPPGTYLPFNGSISSLQCIPCSAGFYCPHDGNTNQIECGVGYYSDTNAANCNVCPRGSYCGSNTTSFYSILNDGGSWSNSGDASGLCFNGTLCDEKMSRAPDLFRNACPVGFYCPAGIDYPIPCPAGRYSSSFGQSYLADCSFTPAGYYSIEASSKPTGLCNPGYYCPLASTSPIQIPCPERTYLPEFGGSSESDCSLCIAGGFCPSGTSTPSVCPQGYYCPTGLSIPLPCLPGTYGKSTGLADEDECTICDGGFYCDGYALTAPRGSCLKGFYCIGGSATSTPQNIAEYMSSDFSLIGGICPPGYYCEDGL